MRTILRSLFFSFLLFFINTNFIFSQAIYSDSLSPYNTLPAGSEYKAGGLHKWFWGSNYRYLWTIPVTVNTINLDTAYTGLKAYAAQNTGESKTVYLKDAQGKVYTLTSVNRKPGNLLYPELRNTIFENRVNDAVSITNPYAGITMPDLADAANAYVPQIAYVYVPKQPALTMYNDAYGNDLYKLSPIINMHENNVAITSGGNYIETTQLLDVLNNNVNAGIDKTAFIRERLLDMFVNDWNRGEDKWAWAETGTGTHKIYVPVTASRDAAYTRYNGKLTRLGFTLTNASLIQSFGDDLKHVSTFNFREKNIDRRLLNDARLSDWQTVAVALQQSLTDTVIEESVSRLPKEIYAETGKDIVDKLKARRSHLYEWATTYYNFLAKETEIPGTYQADAFDVKCMNDSTIVHVFSVNNQGIQNDTPYYSRTFYPSETKEIRLFGLDGKDNYSVSGYTGNGIKLKIINGVNSDSIHVQSSSNSNDLVVYGDKDYIKTTAGTDIKIVSDTAFRSYRYNWYNYDRNGVAPVIFYSNEDRLFIGLEYSRRHYAWGKVPFASHNAVNVHYSLLEKAFSTSYKGVFPKLIAKADLTLYANYDDIRWVFFFGMGNDTKFDNDQKIKYYTMRTRQWIFRPALARTFGNSTVSVFGSVNGIKIIDDTARFLNKSYNPDESVYKWQTFAGAGISYRFQRLNNSFVPTKGLYVDASAAGFQNIKVSSSHYFLYSGNAHIYIPLVSRFSLNIRAGGQIVTGNPEFYQYASIGGVIFRGTVRDRFRGKSAFYNNNDIRFISPVHTHFFAGKAGLLAFVDNGRVWLPGESSDAWHTAFGGGIILAPFNFVYADFNYGFYKKERTLQVRVTFFVP